jgi:P pilus assembly chaperone PapD
MSRIQGVVAAVVAALGVGAAGVAGAQGAGTLGVTPTRVVFEGRTRSSEVLLINRSQAETTYRIHFVQRRMREAGAFEEIDAPRPGELFADALIRYAPRQVTLPPLGSQSVRLLVRKPPELAPGEYRSHLVFQEVPSRRRGETLEPPERGKGEIRVQLVPTFAVSIPVIVRHTELQASVTLADGRLEAAHEAGESPSLHVRLDRDGDRSVYGDLAVSYRPPSGGEAESPIGLLRGVAVYTPNRSRSVRVPLALPAGVALGKGSLSAVYREPPEAGGVVLAEAAFPIP